jgi:hypothetical protein
MPGKRASVRQNPQLDQWGFEQASVSKTKISARFA